MTQVKLTTALVTLATSVAWMSTAAAQTTTYITSQFPGNYQPLTNGTRVQLSSTDDGAGHVPIGFSFPMYGVNYTHMNIGVNGVASPAPDCSTGCAGASCDMASNTCERGGFPFSSPNLPTLAQPNPTLAPFWDDLIIDSTNSPVTEIRTETLGVAPNRVFVIEWANIRHFSNTSAGSSHMSMQVRVFESGLIQFHYGPFVPNMIVGSWSGIIGIENETGTEGETPVMCGVINCNTAQLMALSGQIVQISPLNEPELTGTVVPSTGGQPGDAMQVAVTATNIGTRNATTAFATDVYISSDAVIDPMTDTFLGRLNFGAIDSQMSATETLNVMVPMLMPGFYTVGAILDVDNTVVEVTEANNIVIQQGEFLVGNEIQPAMDTVIVAAPGQPSTLTFRILNLGSALNSVGWELFLSTDATLDGMDTLLASGNAAVPAQPETTITATATLPMVTPGNYRLIARLDNAMAVDEADETNNEAASEPFLVGPELSGSIRGPAQTGPGEQAQLMITLNNVGSEVGDVVWSVYLSQDRMFDVGDRIVDTGTTTLGRARTLTVNATVTIPPIQPVDHYFVVVVDSNMAIPEGDETNNIGIAEDVTMMVGPDVVASAVSGEPIFFRGTTYTVQATLRNDGGATASNFFYAFLLSDNQLITITDPVIGSIGPITLAPGEEIDVRHTLTATTSIPPGEYHLGVIADSTSQVLEELESNNIRRWQTQTVEVRDPAPDFFITDLNAPLIGAAGEVMPIQRTIENGGNATGTVEYNVYLSLDTSLDMNDRLIAQASVQLTNFGVSNDVDVVRVPVDTPVGSYFVIYDLDPANAIDEIIEMNNQAVTDRAVAIEAAELAVQTRSLPLATVNLPFEVRLSASGGTGSYMWSMMGALPNGLTLDPNTGALSGTPTQEGQFEIVVMVTDGNLNAAKMFTLLVSGPTIGLQVVTRNVPPAWLGRRFEYPLTAIGGVRPYSWTTDSVLPSGLTLTEEGIIAGSPNVPGNGIVTFRVTDASGTFDERPISVRVISPDDAVRFSADTLNDGVLGRMYDESFRAVNGVSPYFYALADGELPPGLQLQGERLTGVPTEVGTFVFAVRVTDNRGDFDINRFAININAEEALRFVTSGLPEAMVGLPYADATDAPVRIKAISPTDNASIRYSLAAGELPPGLNLEMDGTVTGTPSAAGVFDFLVTAVDAQDQRDVAAFGISVTEDQTPDPNDPAILGPDDGCTCESSGHSSQSPLSLVSFLAVFGGLFLLRSRKLRKLAAALIALGTVSAAVPASAQTQIPYFMTQSTTPYQERMGGMRVAFSSSDDGQASYSLPFMFRFYGMEYGTVNLSTNGFISFQSQSVTSLSNQNLPNGTNPNALIAPFWDDLNGAQVMIFEDGVAPQRKVTIQYIAPGFGSRQGRINYQITLYEGAGGRFDVHYGAPDNLGSGWSGTMGFENQDGSDGMTFVNCGTSCNNTDVNGVIDRLFTVIQDAGTDIQAASISGPAEVFQGIPFDVTSMVQSLHRNPLGPFNYRIHLLNAGQVDINNPIWTSPMGVMLTAYQLLTVTDSVSIPITTPPGRYRLALELDHDNLLMEPDESNNTIISTSDFVVAERRPDFTIGSVTATPNQVSTGGTVDVAVELENAGNLAATADWIVVLSPNQVISSDDVEVFRQSVTLDPLATQTASVTINVPMGLTPGRYFVGAIADMGNAVLELDEINNTGAATDRISVGVDFVNIETTTLPGGFVGIEYSTFLQSSGGDGNYTYRLASGALPDGLGLISSTGEIRGAPLAASTATFDVEVTSNGRMDTQSLTIEVVEVEGGLTIVTRSVLPGLVGQAYPPAQPGEDPANLQRLIAIGASGQVQFSLTTTPPRGLTLDSDGFLNGVPLQRGTFDLGVTATDGTQTATRTIPITIVEPGRLTLVAANLPVGVVEEPYEFRFQVLGRSGTASVTFALVDGTTLPSGLALTQAGILVGTPTRVGESQFAVEVTEGSGLGAPRDTANFTLRVTADAGFGITPTSLPEATLGEDYDAKLEARGGTAPFVWRITPTTELPRGLRFEVVELGGRQVVQFRGAPEEVPSAAGDGTGGLSTLFVTVTDAVQRQAELSVSIRVVDPEATRIQPVPTSGCVCTTPRDGFGWSHLLAGLILLGIIGRKRSGIR